MTSELTIPVEKSRFDEIADMLVVKLKMVDDIVAERISAELKLTPIQWRQNSDLKFLVTQAENLQNNPKDFLGKILAGIIPHLSNKNASKILLNALRKAVKIWRPQEQPLEIVAEALKITASDVRLLEKTRISSYYNDVVEELIDTISEDSFAVSLRLKQNAFRKLETLFKVPSPTSSIEICPLSDLQEITSNKRTHLNHRTERSICALIITGGRGTRLRTSIPKGLIPLNQRPMINWTIDALKSAGAEDIAVVIGYKGHLHKHILGHGFALIEQEKQLGTAHAVFSAKPFFESYEGPLLISYSDMPFIESHTLQAMVETHLSNNATLTFLTTDRKNRPEFGRVIRKDGKIVNIGQVRFDTNESDEVDAGFYCFDAPMFWKFLGEIRNDNNRREYVLTNIVSRLAEADQKIETYYIDDNVQTIGINRPSELIQAECIAYIRSKPHLEGRTKLESELYWKLRFYEPFGGVSANQIISDISIDHNRIEDVKVIVDKYDQAVSGEISSIFCCPI
jgi:dTDP-glucose pyrophosphorylase